jgi:hypothetical protein
MPRPSTRIAATLTNALICLAPSVAHAQDSEHEWQKDYHVTANPSLTLETGDTGLDIHSCGDCKSIRIHVHSTRALSEFRLEEHQDADHVYFLLKEKPHVGFHISWNDHQSTQVTVDTPAALTLDARTGDGNVTARDLTGDIAIHSGDGSVTLDHVHGALHLTASDGNIDIHNATGTLEARASDGRMKIDGQFTAVQLHTSDGNLDFDLSPGSKLATASRIESSDGRVSIHVPHDLSADLDVSTSDGKVECSLPLTRDHYNSGQHIHGRLNAGGVPLTIHTSDGNVTIASL